MRELSTDTHIKRLKAKYNITKASLGVFVMIEYFSSSAGHIYEGVEILRYRIVLPRITGNDNITDFYREIFDSTLLFCKGELCKYSEEKYLLCDLPKKRFNYSPIVYRLEGRVTHADSECLFVKLTASVCQRGGSDSTRAYDAHAWSLSDGRLLPPRAAAREYLQAKRLPREIKGKEFLIDGGKAYICTPTELTPLDIPIVQK